MCGQLSNLLISGVSLKLYPLLPHFNTFQKMQLLNSTKKAFSNSFNFNGWFGRPHFC